MSDYSVVIVCGCFSNTVLIDIVINCFPQFLILFQKVIVNYNQLIE